MRSVLDMAERMRGKGDKGGDVIIRKEEVIAGGHHGGAWKVAYADFVTAMMAFFLLMWLLNATTEEQRKGLADYFSPSNLMSHASSGTGQPFGGRTPFDDGAMVSDRGAVNVLLGRHPEPDAEDEGEVEVGKNAASGRAEDGDDQASRQFERTGGGTAPADPATNATGRNQQAVGAAANPDDQGGGPSATAMDQMTAQQAQKAQRLAEAEQRLQREQQERAAFDKAADEIRAAVRDDPTLHDLMKQLAIDMTPEGLRIQLLDEERQPMFATGSASPNDRARLLLQKITPVLMRLPQGISLAGYTDAARFAGSDRTNWELSTDRANMTRRVLMELGLPETRIRTVTGHADRDPLLPNDPLAAVNRRIAIVVLREARNAPTASRSIPSGPIVPGSIPPGPLSPGPIAPAGQLRQ